MSDSKEKEAKGSGKTNVGKGGDKVKQGSTETDSSDSKKASRPSKSGTIESKTIKTSRSSGSGVPSNQVPGKGNVGLSKVGNKVSDGSKKGETTSQSRTEKSTERNLSGKQKSNPTKEKRNPKTEGPREKLEKDGGKRKKSNSQPEQNEDIAPSSSEDTEANEEFEDDVLLMYRHDSDLSYPQMIEKDIIWYDLLTGENETIEGEASIFDLPTEIGGLDTVEEEEEVVDEAEIESLDISSTEEEEVREEEAEVVVQEQPLIENPDDPDNIVNLMMQDEEEDDGIELLFMDSTAMEPETESIATFPGVVGINLTEPTIEFLEMKDLNLKEPPYTYISFKRAKLHIYMFQEASEFYPYRDLLTHYPDFAILVGLDTSNATGHTYFMCTSLEGRNMVLNPPKTKRKFVDTKKKDEELWKKLSSITPRKWRSLGSEIEVALESGYKTRPLITMHAYRYIESFNRPYVFTDTKMEGNINALSGFESIDPEKIPLLEITEKTVGVQVMPPKTTATTQTGFSFKRNKIAQYENQFLDTENIRVILEKLGDTITKKTRALQRSLLQNEMMNLAKDDYKLALKALKGHEIEYSEESVVLEEYQTYSDLRHSKGRTASWMTFYPSLDDVIVIAMAENTSFDKRIEFHSKMIMEPNFVLIWDLKDPIHPQIMLDAPSDVFSFMINPSDPQLICGGCANGQVVLWDLRRDFVELKARVQDRRRKVKERRNSKLQFLEKLKDTVEKYSCPLIAPVGLSNLDQSHKKLVTSVCWLPSHVELGKNGTLYDNVAGRSFQFFSAAGDGTVRLWDIRPSKLGLDEYEAMPSDMIRSNAYIHLENNNWKYTTKYQLDDGSGMMLVTLLSLSEARQEGDTISFDTLTRRQGSGSNININSSVSGNKVESSSSQQVSKSGDIIPTQVESKEGHVSSTSTPMATWDVAPTTVGTEEVDIDAVSNQARRAAGMLNTLNTAQSSIFIGTEIGQVGLVDWLRSKDGPINPESGQRIFANMFLQTIHDGAITCLARSPFYYSLILVIGGGTVSIWKETSSHPLLAMAGSEQFPLCGCWSNTRPAVFFVGTLDGALQVWDLTEKSHLPVLVQQISPERITNVALPRAKLAKKQFLALSDSVGNLFVMLLSGYYYKPNKTENSFMLELMYREEKRLVNWIGESENRNEKMEVIHNNWQESRVTKTADQISSIESELEARLNAEYGEFIEFEGKLATKLKRDEPSVSVEDLEVDVRFDELLEAAKQKETELDDGEEEDTYSRVSLGSEFDFLLRTSSPNEIHRSSKISANSQDEYQ